MFLQPGSLDELRTALAAASHRRERISQVDLSSFTGLVEHAPEDMTATVRAGTLLADFQNALRARGQWLPVDPPLPHETTLARLLGWSLSGPRSQGFGLVRDYVIGMKVVLADGELIKAGGKVVKNVAGYDLCKLFIGARETLGIIVEATFKLRPLPERERILQRECKTLEEADQAVTSLQAPGFEPVILDLHNLGGAGDYITVAGFAGATEEVELQVDRALGLGFREDANMQYAEVFWRESVPPGKLSVLPSRLVTSLRELGQVPFVARAGRGVIFHRDTRPAAPADLPWTLMRQVKAAYDPHNILPEYTA